MRQHAIAESAAVEIELTPEQVAAVKKSLRSANARLISFERERQELKQNIALVATLLKVPRR